MNRKKDIKKLRLNRKIQKETLNKDLAEIYAPVTKNQEKQTEIIKQGQKDQIEAIENQTNEIKAITSLPSTSSIESTERTTPAIESSQSEDEFHDIDIKSLDSAIQTSLAGLLNPINSLPNFVFKSSDINNYTVNNQSFKVIDNKLIFDDERIFEFLLHFLIYSLKVIKKIINTYQKKNKIALPWFVEYAGGLKMDKKSNLYKAIKYWQESI